MDLNTGVVNNFIGKTFPRLVVHKLARRPFKGISHDENNFRSADELRTLLLGYDIVSFDYFDTLASRNISLPAVQDLTARYGAALIAAHRPNFPDGHLRHCRTWFSQQLKQYYSSLPKERYRNEVELWDLFERALRPYFDDADQRGQIADSLLAYEVSLEKQVLKPNEEFRELLEFLKAHGKTVILTSDMYLSRSDMIEITKDQGLFHLFDHVFVSATSGITKNSGKLFDHIDETLAITTERRIHLGDNFTNDFVRPRDRGWDALHYFHPPQEIKRRELELEYRLGPSTEASRFKKFLKTYLKDGESDALHLLAASFAVFVRRLVERAHRNNVDHVLFLTRDGTLFGDITKTFLKSYHGQGFLPETKLGILASNRRVGAILNYPGFKDRGWLEHHVGYLNNTPISLRTIMKTFAVTPDDLQGLSQSDQKLVAKCLSVPQSTDLNMEDLSKRPVIQRALDLALHKKKDQARQYLEQEGILDPKKSVMLVDIGYSGTLLRSMSHLMFTEQVRQEKDTGETGAQIDLCLFATNRYLNDNLRQMHPNCSVGSGLIIDAKTPAKRALSTNFSWLEPFCLDRSLGSLQGYQEDDDNFMQPIFGQSEEHPDHLRLRTSLLTAAQNYFDLSVQSNLGLDQLDNLMVEEMIHCFAVPSSETVSLVKELLHDAGNSESRHSSVVQRLSWFRLRKALFEVHGDDKWVQGSLQNSGLRLLIPAFNFLISRAFR